MYLEMAIGGDGRLAQTNANTASHMEKNLFILPVT